MLRRNDASAKRFPLCRSGANREDVLKLKDLVPRCVRTHWNEAIGRQAEEREVAQELARQDISLVELELDERNAAEHLGGAFQHAQLVTFDIDFDEVDCFNAARLADIVDRVDVELECRQI